MFRHAASQTLRQGADALLPEKRWAVVNPWDAPKDGKQRLSDTNTKWMRK